MMKLKIQRKHEETEVRTEKQTEKKNCKSNSLRASQSVALRFLSDIYVWGM
jgi:hypothetical protein